MGNKFYKSELVANGQNADALMLTLWHFTNLFTSFSFEVNGKAFIFLSEEAPKAHLIKENESNTFTLFFDAQNEGVKKDMEILNYVLSPLYEVPSFVPAYE